MQAKSRASSSSSTYSHLLYLNNEERDNYCSAQYSSSQPSLYQLSPNRPESTSFFSMSSSRCSSVRSSMSSFQDSVSTGPSSVKSATTISTPKHADNHYPLITSINPSSIVNVPADVPKSHAAFACAMKMAAIHNTMIRALNSAYNHAPSIEADTPRCKSFLKFNEVLITMLDHHHEVEDNYMFPAWEQLMGRPGGMEENIKGHEAFMEGFRTFQKYVSDPNAAQTYDATKFRKIVNNFAPNLIQHLHDEIPTIVSLCVYDNDKLNKIWDHAEKLATKDADMYLFGPMVLGCQDKDFRIDGEIPDFPGMPWIAEVLVKKWYARKHADIWEFLPSDLSGQRRLLKA